MRGTYQVAAKSIQIVHLGFSGEKALRLSGGFESTHPAFVLSGVLMRPFTSVVCVTIVTVDNRCHDLSLGCCVAWEFVGNHSSWRFALSLQHFTEKPLGSTLVFSALHENIDDIAVLVDCAPKIMSLTVYRYHHLIHKPPVAELPATFSECVRVVGTELCTPQTNRLV